MYEDGNMGSPYLDQGFEDNYSHRPRSRADSRTSSVLGAISYPRQLEQLAESPATSYENSSYLGSRPASSQGLASPAYLSPALCQPATFQPTPVSQTHSPLPLVPEGVLDVDWFKAAPPNSQGNPLLRVEPAPQFPQLPSSPSRRPSSITRNMSAVAIQYDPGFSMGSKSSFNAWPGVMESSNGLLGHDLSHYASDASSMTPPSGSRSVTASPPRGGLTADIRERELRRQRDQVRRDQKMQVRAHRTGSGSSSVYSPPATMVELSTSASSLPIYTTAPAQMSLLADGSTTSYLPSFSSPPLDQSQNGMFPSPYPPSTYMPEYSTYATTAAPSLPSQQYGRPLMTTDPTMAMYGPVMGGPAPTDAAGQVRVVQSRPKPTCWEHGCNGRQFSTFSNLLRHQREKSGQAAKAVCPNCGAEFTRTTARNGHLLHDKCKSKRSSGSGSTGSSS